MSNFASGQRKQPLLKVLLRIKKQYPVANLQGYADYSIWKVINELKFDLFAFNVWNRKYLEGQYYWLMKKKFVIHVMHDDRIEPMLIFKKNGRRQ